MPDQSYELNVALPHGPALVLCDALEEITPAAGLLENGNGWIVQAWFETPPDEALISQLIRQANHGKNAAYTVKPLQQQDWVAKSLEGLKPVQVGPFAVHGSHDREHFPVNLHKIIIDAGLAFGTGHHGTTAACLLALSRHLKISRPERVLDLGTGSGVLAIAAAKALRQQVIASDIDPVAVEVAKANARINNARHFVRPFTASGFHHPRFAETGPYDLILANILAQPLARLAPDIRAHLAPGGTAILSGLLKHQARSVLAAYRIQKIVPVAQIVMEGWVTLAMRG